MFISLLREVFVWLSMKNYYYGIVIVVLAIAAIGLFMPGNLINTSGIPADEGLIKVKQSGGSAAMIQECGDRSYISGTADYVVEGVVEKAESRDTGTGIFTYSDVRIDRYIKGNPLPDNRIQIVTPGGTVGGIAQYVEDQPIFHEGTNVRLYFTGANGEFFVVCGPFGVEEI